MSNQNSDIFKSTVLGQPSGLFVLFFTEMWERFSYYGMRALLVLFLVSAFGLGGWDWPISHALSLYGTYTALVYITPILGGHIADKFIGYRKAVIIGAVIMTLGHVSMAIESGNIFLYIGIGLLIIGNGLFKPNVTSIISHMYKDTPEKKDGAFTIFYMGVNAGAFLGILLCGYIGEKVGWNYGFGLAGIFMLLGMLQFYFSQKIFGDIGTKPVKTEEAKVFKPEFEGDKLNPFTLMDKVLIVIAAVIGVVWVINDPVSKIAGINVLEFSEIDYSNTVILIGLFAFLILIVSRLVRYPKITRDRMVAIIIFAVMTVIFWMSFEQAGGSMTLFAKDFTNRVMTGNYYYIYLVVNILITVVPIAIITWVLFKLFKQTFKKYKFANLILGFSFAIIWAIVFWMINRDLNSSSYVVDYQAIKTELTTESYELSKDRSDAFEEMIVDDASFLNAEGEDVSLEKIVYQGKNIEHKHSEKAKKSERETEQEKFDATYLSEVLAIEDMSEATVVYAEKDKTLEVKMSELYFETVVTEETVIADGENVIEKSTTVIEPVDFKLEDKLSIIDVNKKGKFIYLNADKESNVRKLAEENKTDTYIVQAKVSKLKENEVEIASTWFLILNSLFIIAFAPLFSKWWESKYNPSASSKYGLGLILLGVGFGALAFGSNSIAPGAKIGSVSLIWLVLAYLFHTLGELCLSPVALSYVSKLVPGRMIAMMFGVWYIAVAIGNKLAGLLGGQIESITEKYDMQTFFLIFTVIPIVLGLIGIALTKVVKKLMHGVK